MSVEVLKSIAPSDFLDNIAAGIDLYWDNLIDETLYNIVDIKVGDRVFSIRRFYDNAYTIDCKIRFDGPKVPDVTRFTFIFSDGKTPTEIEVSHPKGPEYCPGEKFKLSDVFEKDMEAQMLIDFQDGLFSALARRSKESGSVEFMDNVKKYFEAVYRTLSPEDL